MKNRAFKMYLKRWLTNEEIAKVILAMLSEQNEMAFDLMDESGAPFTPNGYKQAAQLVIDQTNDEERDLNEERRRLKKQR